MSSRDFSFPTLTEKDLGGRPFRLNELLKWLAEQISKVQGANGPFTFSQGPFTFRGQVSFSSSLNAVNPFTLSNLPEYPDNAAALAAGLPYGRLYRTATGVVMVVYEP
jgi:hypothetical protein